MKRSASSSLSPSRPARLRKRLQPSLASFRAQQRTPAGASAADIARLRGDLVAEIEVNPGVPVDGVAVLAAVAALRAAAAPATPAAADSVVIDLDAEEDDDDVVDLDACDDAPGTDGGFWETAAMLRARGDEEGRRLAREVEGGHAPGSEGGLDSFVLNEARGAEGYCLGELVASARAKLVVIMKYVFTWHFGFLSAAFCWPVLALGETSWLLRPSLTCFLVFPLTWIGALQLCD